MQVLLGGGCENSAKHWSNTVQSRVLKELSVKFQ